MPSRDERNQATYDLRFGGGTHTRPSPEDIGDHEDAGGKNFDLDVEDMTWRPRFGIRKVAEVTNSARINGFAQVRKPSGALSTLIQAGGNVYHWDLSDGASALSGFTLIDTVEETARLTGTLDSQWSLDDKVIIADRGLAENIKEWDGKTFQDLEIESASNCTQNLRAKYAVVDNERLWLANLLDGVKPLPHMVAVSGREEPGRLTTFDRPTSALGAADPFQITSPDLRAINGLVISFGSVVYSTFEGNMYRLLGDNTRNFAHLPLFSGSGATGEEGVVFVGNDVFWGRGPVIESLSAAETLGDVTVDDITRKIFTEKAFAPIKNIKEWTLVYDRNRGLLYCFGNDRHDCWVFHKALWDEVVRTVSRRDPVIPSSPWVRWEMWNSSVDRLGIHPTRAWEMYDNDGVRQIYWGNEAGEIFQMQSKQLGDTGPFGNSFPTAVKSERRSRILTMPEGSYWELEGYLLYVKTIEDYTVTLTFRHQGIECYDQSITLTLPGHATDETAFFDENSTTNFFAAACTGEEAGEYCSHFGDQNGLHPRIGKVDITNVAGRSSSVQVVLEHHSSGGDPKPRLEVTQLHLRFITAPQS